MYLTKLKAAVVEALRATFTAAYPEADFRGADGDGLWVSIEYPVAKASYPGLWVDYSDSDELRVAGIGHEEFVELVDGPHRVTRWRFGGEITVTVVALSSLERDRLFDELVRIFAFARENEAVSEFRELIEQNDLMAMNINFDTLRVFGDNAAPGTPWETEEIIYEKSVSMDVIGEFVGDPTTATLVRLSQIRATGYPAGTPEPRFPDDPPGVSLDPGLPGSVPHDVTVFDPARWH